MNPSIFISYCRGDSGYASSVIDEHLAAHFGPDSVLLDVDYLLGIDYQQAIAEAVRQSSVSRGDINDSWLSQRNPTGER